MADQQLLSRRAFTVESALAILAAATITITGCDDNQVGPSPPPGAREGVVSANHGHRAVVQAAELSSTSSISIDMRYQATHNHTLTLTAPELAVIAENGRVVRTSSTTDDHSHTVTFN